MICQQKYLKYIFFIVIWYAIFLRFYDLWTQSFWIDEGFSSYSTTSWTNLQYYIHNLSQLISFKLFTISDWSARFPSVIFSVLNIFLIYLISYNLFKDKKQAIFVTLIFSFLTWEIIWARQARFYTLLQLIFSLNLYFIIKTVQNFSFKYLNLAIIFLYIWILFHPFLWSSLIIFILGIFYLLYLNREKLSFKKNLSKKYFLTFFIIFIILAIEFFKYFFSKQWISVPNSTEIPQKFIENYIKNYSNHLNVWLWIMPTFAIFWMFILIYKRKILETIVLSFSYLFIFYVISQKWFLYHTRYIFILYPIIIILSAYSIFYFYDLIKNKYLKNSFFIIILISILFTAKFTFLPQTYYTIDYTSPQPDFKQAYKKIPKWQEIISGFPMMCEWYYAKKWKCLYHLPVDYVWSKQAQKRTLERWKDNYTWIKYLLNLEQLEKWKKYYFVLDNLSIQRAISQNIIKEIFKSGKIIFDNWKTYNNIKVVEYIK